MAKCSHCRRRKAKRTCPARRVGLCPLCCGQLRNRGVVCPPGCRHLAEHGPYQEQRLLERKAEIPAGTRPGREDPLEDERLAWLAVQSEAPLRDLALRKPEFSDGDVILALEYAKEKLKKGQGLIVIPGAERPATNDAGEAVFQSLDECRFERSVVLTAGSSGYTTEEKVRVLDRLILAAKTAAGGDFKGRAYVDRIAASFAEMERGARDTKLILPR
jgi:hypothetical protein